MDKIGRLEFGVQWVESANFGVQIVASEHYEDKFKFFVVRSTITHYNIKSKDTI